jgi:uncharacterized protein YwqG
MSWLERLLSTWRAKRAPQSIDEHLVELDEIVVQMRQSSLPCVRFDRGISASKLGGLPDLPDGLDWPGWKGRPLAFLAQIDLASAHDAGGPDWLPDTGMLFFFYDPDQSTWGFDPEDRGSWAVLYGPHGSRAARNPSSITPFPEIRIIMRSDQSLPSPERLGVNLAALSSEQWEAVDTMLLADAPAHQLGGHPLAIQNEEMEEDCQLTSNGIYMGNPEAYHTPEAERLKAGAADWQLLMQIDSDDDADMMWGDLGRLYFWIRRQDVEARDFSKVWMILQCS